MLRFHSLLTVLLLVALLASACQPLITTSRLSNVTEVSFTCRVTPGEEQEVAGVIHHRGQRDEGVSFASDPRLDGVYANLLDWNYVAATGGGAFVLTTVVTTTMRGGAWTGHAAGYFAGGIGGFTGVMVGTGAFAGLEFVFNGVATELETASALIAGNERVIDGNPCAELKGEATEAVLLYGQLIDRRPVMSTPSQ